jgi:RNA polymerase sigma factor (sigma-70 family)
MTAPEVARVADAALIEKSWHDPTAFADIYDRHAGTIHRYVARRLGPAVADDLVAETFLTAFRRRGSYDLDRADATPWLYGIAANLIGKHRRTEVRMLRAFARTGHDPVLAGHADQVDEQVSAGALHRELAAALAQLSSGDRDVLLLVAWAYLSYEEVADALRIPVGTVRSRLNRARRKTRAALGDVDPRTSKELSS